MFKMNKISAAALIVLGGSFAVQASAQDATLERVEVTGSAIKRLDAETAVPVTIFKMSEMKQQGLTTVEQILGSLSAMQTQLGTSQAVGASSGGASFADLRGVGPNKTLVLLNGRRIANNAFDGSAPDLNMIPVAALDRVEVLRDGASSLYGTDAIGGVINFITKKDYTGGTVSVEYESPQHPGGKSHSINGGFGFGDLEKQGFNVFGFADYQKQNNISGTQRDYNTRYPGGISGSTSPANWFQGNGGYGTTGGTGTTAVFNPAAPNCTTGTFLTPAGDNVSCFMTTSSFVDYIPKSERKSGMLKGEFKLSPDHVLGAEYFVSRSQVETLIAGVPYGALIQNPTRPDGTPNPYYPGNSGSGFGIDSSMHFDPAYTDAKVGTVFVPGGSLTTPGADGSMIQPGYVNVKWRDVPNGPRGDRNTNTQQRFVLSLDGTLAGWDYSAAATYNKNKVDEKLISGYNNGLLIQEGVLDGIINPFGAQDADGQKLVDQALAVGTVLYGQATTKGVDAHASRELGDWFHSGNPVALAIGAETRKESFTQQANTDYASIVVASTGIDPSTFNSGSRRVSAVYGELNMPLLKSLEVTAAVRYDKYSDFGSTTNPKFSFRFQPTKEFLLRGAYSTGFRAPSVYELHASQAYGTGSTVNDPITCPDGNPTGAKVNNCKAQFETLRGGNLTLKPEKSKTANLGFVFEPTRDSSVGLDFWWLRLKDSIGAIADGTLFDPANNSILNQFFHRDSTGHLSTDGTQCPGSDCGYVDALTRNLGGVNTSGIDFTGQYRLHSSVGTFTFGLNSTYVSKYEYQDFADGPWNQNVGVYSGTGPIFRWKHTVNVVWAKDQFTAGVTGHYESGYIDSANDYVDNNKVGSYATMDIFGTWRVTKGAALTLGVHNLTDRNPPLSYQTEVFQAGYDPRFTNPTGRSYYVRGSYDF